MFVSIVATIGIVASYGVATVLQAVGARRAEGSDQLDPRLLLRVAGRATFVIGLGLDVVGVGCTILALRQFPLFLVQAAVAASVAVTALLSARVFHTPLGRAEWGGIGAVMAGLVLLVAASGPEGPPSTSSAFRYGLVGAAILIVALGAVVGRVADGRSAAALGALAGLAYGLGNVALRVVIDLHPVALLRNPAVWAAIIAAVAGVLFFATALQRGAVTTVTGAMVVSETVLPALLGLLVLSERPRPGWWPVAVLGFALAIGGALALSRFGEAPEAPAPAPHR